MNPFDTDDFPQAETLFVVYENVDFDKPGVQPKYLFAFDGKNPDINDYLISRQKKGEYIFGKYILGYLSEKNTKFSFNGRYGYIVLNVYHTSEKLSDLQIEEREWIKNNPAPVAPIEIAERTKIQITDSMSFEDKKAINTCNGYIYRANLLIKEVNDRRKKEFKITHDEWETSRKERFG